MKLKKLLLLMLIIFNFSYAKSLSDAIKNGEVKGSLRSVYLNYDYDVYFSDSEAFGIGGRISYKSDNFNNFKIASTFSTSQGFGLNNPKDLSMAFMYPANGKSFSILEEFYLKYQSNKNTLTIGRQGLNSLFINSDDGMIVPNSFNAIYLINEYFKDIKLEVAHIRKMSGTWDSKADGSKFLTMSKVAWNEPNYYDLSTIVGNSSTSFISVTYSSENFKFQLMDFYASEMFNAVFSEFNYEKNLKDINLNFGLQYTYRKEIGKLKDSEINVDYSVYGVKLGLDFKNEINLSTTLTTVSDDDSIHFFGAWGGYPEFAYGMMITYFDTSLQDSDIYMLNIDYDLSKIGLKDLSTTLRYTYYNLNSEFTKNSYAPNGEGYMNAYGLALSYNINKNLSLNFKYGTRKLDSGNKSKLFRSRLVYNF